MFQIWDVATSTRLYAPLRLHQSWVTDIQFSTGVWRVFEPLKKLFLKRLGNLDLVTLLVSIKIVTKSHNVTKSKDIM